MSQTEGTLLRCARIDAGRWLVLLFTERHGFVVGVLGENGDLREHMTHDGVEEACLDFDTRSGLAAIGC